MERAVDGQGDYPLADLAFHTAILSSCNNQFLQQICKVMSEVLHRNFKILVKRSGGPFFSLPLHQRLCRAIETGDAEMARQVALQVIEQAEDDLKILNGE
jgi:DNA-binding FadR family transcriptional regulator